jgi:hypothetical protein
MSDLGEIYTRSRATATLGVPVYVLHLLRAVIELDESAEATNTLSEALGRLRRFYRCLEVCVVR